MRRLLSISLLLVFVMLCMGCSHDVYSAAHTGVSAVDSFAIWGRMPPLDRNWFVNPYGLLNDALDPRVWGNQPVQSGW